MTTIRWNNFDYNLLYVDPQATGANDGSTPANALTDLPVFASMLNNTFFLIRRNERVYSVTHRSGARTDLERMVFMGMPKSTQPEYTMMPQEAKTAWGADTALYASYKSLNNSDRQYYNNSPKHLTWFGLDIYRATGVTRGDVLFRVEGNDHVTNVLIDHCKLGSESAEISTATSPVITSTYCGYFYFVSTLNFKLSNSIIDHCSDGGNGSVHVNRATSLVLQNNQFYIASGHYDARAFSCPSGISANINNNDAKLRINGTASNSRYGVNWFGIGSFDYIDAHNISASYMDSLGVEPTNYGHHRHFIAIGDTSTYAIHASNWDIDLSKSFRTEDGQYLVYIGAGSNGNYVFRRKSYVHDLKISCGTDLSVNVARASFADVNHGSYNYHLLHITGNSTPNGAQMRVENIDVDNYFGPAFYVAYANVDKINVRGGFKAAYCTGRVETVESWFPSSFLNITTGAKIYIENVIGNKDNPEHTYTQAPASIQTLQTDYALYVNTSNIPIMSSEVFLNATKANHNNVMVCNNQGAVGNFMQKTYNQLVTSWDAQRNNGGVVLKISHNAYSGNNFWLELGQKPNMGYEVMPAGLGWNKFKLYVAAKDIPSFDDLSGKFFAHIDVPYANDDSNSELASLKSDMSYSSGNSGVWKVDEDSTWSESGLNKYCIEMPVFIYDETIPVEVRIRSNVYSAFGYIYVDISNMSLEVMTLI